MRTQLRVTAAGRFMQRLSEIKRRVIGSRASGGPPGPSARNLGNASTNRFSGKLPRIENLINRPSKRSLASIELDSCRLTPRVSAVVLPATRSMSPSVIVDRLPSIGLTAGLIVWLLLTGNIAASFLNTTPRQNTFALIAIALLAGASERLLPSLIQTFDDSIKKKG